MILLTNVIVLFTPLKTTCFIIEGHSYPPVVIIKHYWHWTSIKSIHPVTLNKSTNRIVTKNYIKIDKFSVSFKTSHQEVLARPRPHQNQIFTGTGYLPIFSAKLYFTYHFITLH